MTATAKQEKVCGQEGPAEGQERMVLPSSAVKESSAPGRVLIAPWGDVQSANGAFTIDEEAGRLVVESFRAHGTDVPIDYEHQSLGGSYASPSGQAPAAGWIRALSVDGPGEADDMQAGLYAEVEWTASARERISAKEYRYLSPVVIVRKSDRRVVALHSAALTNKPAIVGMRPIVNRDARADAAEAGSLDGGRGEPGAGEACEAVELLRLRLGLDAERDLAEVLVAAEGRLAALDREAGRREAREKVDRLFSEGKLSAAQEAWALAMAERAPELFEQWAESAPVLAMPGRIPPPASSCGRSGRNRAAVIASARSAYRAAPELSQLTSESAWIAGALRDAGLPVQEER